MKRNLTLLFVFFLFFSCSKDVEENGVVSKSLLNLTHDEFVSIAFDNPQELKTEDAIALASNFLNSMKSEGVTTRNISSNFSMEVSSKSYFTSNNATVSATRSSNNLELPIYEVSVTEDGINGVIYVSGDERYPQVISYIPQTSEDVTVYNESGAIFFVEWAKASALDEVIKIEQIRKQYREATISKISRELGIPESEVTYENVKDRIMVNGEVSTRATPIQAIPTQIMSYVTPLVPVQWNQTPPYNRLLPAPLPPSTQTNVYTGCAVTAIAQLLTACKPTLTIAGTAIDWNYLTETPVISTNAPKAKLDMLGNLFKWIYTEVAAMPQYDEYGYHNGTGVYTYMSSWFLSNYLNSGQMIAYDPDVLLASLNQRKPSWISGQNHAFIVDGYVIARQATTANPTTNTAGTRAQIVLIYDMYWHINLGWGGSYDGYYKLNKDTHVDIEAGARTYNTQYLSIQPNLSKKN